MRNTEMEKIELSWLSNGVAVTGSHDDFITYTQAYYNGAKRDRLI